MSHIITSADTLTIAVITSAVIGIIYISIAIIILGRAK